VLPADTQQSLLERAEGNPLYAEQFALLYAERGSADELPLPENLQGIVAARLDGLPPAEKALLQDASVIGKVFWTGCLHREAQESEHLLRELARKGFVRRQLRSSVAGEDEHTFAHVLVRDVAYGQIPRGARSQKHGLVARWIESLGRPEDHAEMIAHHWRSAYELALAAGLDGDDLADRTRVALRDAGDRAYGLSAYPAAAGYYGEALELWPTADPSRADVLFRRARSLHLATDDRREQALVEAHDALLAVGDNAQAAEASSFLARIAWYQGGQDAALRHLEVAEQLIAGMPPSGSKTRVLAQSARHRILGGDTENGIQLANAALEMARELGLPELEAHALGTIGTARLNEGEGGRNELARAVEIALEINSPVAGTLLVNLGVEAGFAGNIPREDELFAEAQRVAERFGDRDTVRFTRGDRVWTRWALGHWDEATAMADAFIAECAESPHYLESHTRMVRAWMRHGRGDVIGASEDAERALELGRRAGDPQALLPSLVQCSYFEAMSSRLERARSLAREAIDFIRAHPDNGMILEVLTPVVGRLGLRDEVAELLARAPDSMFEDAGSAAVAGDHARAAEIFAAAGAPTHEAFQRLAAAESLINAGRLEEGEVELERALAFYRSVGATAYIDRGTALRVSATLSDTTGVG
jgi:tetratricopeptide (TPR) repeat protein